jgi:hypothetical protein
VAGLITPVDLDPFTDLPSIVMVYPAAIRVSLYAESCGRT